MKHTVVVLALLAFNNFSVHADDFTPSKPVVEDAALADSRLTVLARQALQRQFLLARFNLGVTVQDRKATLWGVVDSADVSRLAEDTLRQVSGMASVRNELRIERTPPPGKAQFAHSLSPKPEDAASVRRPRPTGNVAGLMTWTPTATPTIPTVSLGSPVSAAPRPQRPAEQVGLADAVKRIRDSEARFRDVRVDVDGKSVFIRGLVSRWEDAFELATMLSRVTGVERVVMDQITSTNRLPLHAP